MQVERPAGAAASVTETPPCSLTTASTELAVAESLVNLLTSEPESVEPLTAIAIRLFLSRAAQVVLSKASLIF